MLDHSQVFDAQTALREQCALLRAHWFRRIARKQPQQGVAQFSALELVGVILQLVEQHRHPVDHRAHARMVLEMPGHVCVILDRMQVHPGQRELAASLVAVIRLVHVPNQHQIEGARRAHRMSPDSAATEAGKSGTIFT